MSKAKILAIALTAIVILAGGFYILNSFTGTKEPVSMLIDWTVMDQYLGERDAATTEIDIYRLLDSNLVKQENIVLDAANHPSALVYTSGEELYVHMYDEVDTSLCTQYLQVTVPQADAAAVYDGAFQITLFSVDKGDTAKDILIQYHNNTAIAASATLDVTNESWDSNYAEIDFEMRVQNDDTGYWNSFNFLNEYDNDHFVILKATGTGWDSMNLLTSGWTVYDKASARYFVKALDNNDASRDKQAKGVFNPDGVMATAMVWDLTGFESGDSVTLTYEYRWYSSWAQFQASSAWGVNTAATSESVTVQY